MPFAEEHLPELYRLVIGNLNDTAVFLIDLEGRIASWNPGVEQLFGYREDEFLGRPVSLVFVPEEVRAGVPERELLEAARDGRAADQRWHHRKDGSRLFIDGVLVALKDAGGALIGYAKIMRDITPRKRAADDQKFLADAGATLAASLDYDTTLGKVARLAVETLADYCVFNLVTAEQQLERVTWAHRDQACERMMSRVLETLPPTEIGEHPFGSTLMAGEAVFVPDVTREWMERNLRRRAVIRIAEQFGLRSAMIVPVPGRTAVLGALTFCRDRTSGARFDEQDLQLATELGRRAGLAIDNARLYRAATESEARLQERERTLRMATDAAGVGIWSMDLRTGTLALSPQCKRLFAMTPDAPDPSYDDFLRMVHPEDRERVDAAVKRALEALAEYDAEFRCVWPDGSLRVLAAKGMAQEDDSGRAVRFNGVVLDVTERVHREAAAAEAHRLDSIGTLAGGIAHEFNNLLTGVIGNATLVAEELPRSSPGAARLDDMLRSAERAAELTRQLLAYAGKGRYMPRPIDLSGEVGRVAALLSASVPRRVKLRLDLARDLPSIEADSSQVQQVAVDLVINAGEAIGEDAGTVEVRTAAVDLDDAAVHGRFSETGVSPGRYVTLEVRDSGTGMDEPVRSRMFEPFFSTKFAGRGLGLAAVQGIVRSHRGALEVNSAPGRGTVVRAYFPAAREAVALPAEHRSVEAAPKTILVVDDEELVRKVAKAVLEKRGFSVVLAENGQAAVEAFRRMPGGIAAVLLDMTMPVMSGEEAMARIREIRPDVPVIASSGYNEAEALRRFGAGVSAYIQKPYTAGRLADVVESVAA